MKKKCKSVIPVMLVVRFVGDNEYDKARSSDFCASVVFVTMCMLDTTLIGRYSQILKNSL